MFILSHLEIPAVHITTEGPGLLRHFSGQVVCWMVGAPFPKRPWPPDRNYRPTYCPVLCTKGAISPLIRRQRPEADQFFHVAEFFLRI